MLSDSNISPKLSTCTVMTIYISRTLIFGHGPQYPHIGNFLVTISTHVTTETDQKWVPHTISDKDAAHRLVSIVPAASYEAVFDSFFLHMFLVFIYLNGYGLKYWVIFSYYLLRYRTLKLATT